MKVSVEKIKEQPLLPVVVLGGFFAGVLMRVVFLGRHERSYWAQNLEAWFALIAVLLMSIAAIIHLVINPTLFNPFDMPHWEGFLAGVVTFYFGVRT
jgi:hypothetical protein